LGKILVTAQICNNTITLKPPVFSQKDLQFDGTLLFSTCRIITLTHLDYNGTATRILRDNLQNESFVLLPETQTSSALEFRTLMCVARMAQTALARFPYSVQQLYDEVALFNREIFKSTIWTIAHLRLGEMQTLEALKHIAFSGLHQAL
jgi:hypothetical protein